MIHLSAIHRLILTVQSVLVLEFGTFPAARDYVTLLRPAYGGTSLVLSAVLFKVAPLSRTKLKGSGGMKFYVTITSKEK